MCIEYHIYVNMYHVSAQGTDVRAINVHYYDSAPFPSPEAWHDLERPQPPNGVTNFFLSPGHPAWR